METDTQVFVIWPHNETRTSISIAAPGTGSGLQCPSQLSILTPNRGFQHSSTRKEPVVRRIGICSACNHLNDLRFDHGVLTDAFSYVTTHIWSNRCLQSALQMWPLGHRECSGCRSVVPSTSPVEGESYVPAKTRIFDSSQTVRPSPHSERNEDFGLPTNCCMLPDLNNNVAAEVEQSFFQASYPTSLCRFGMVR